jgi:putative transposase
LKKGQFSDEQIVAVLQAAEKGDKTIQALCREYEISENTFYRWRSRFGGAAPADVQKSREMEKENLRLKRLLAERDLEVDILRELLAKK